MQGLVLERHADEIKPLGNGGSGLGWMEMGAAPGLRRTVVLVSADPALRHRLRVSLSRMRWQVREAEGGADAMEQMEEQVPEVLLLDHWLPDLEVTEFAEHVRNLYPGVDLLRVDGDPVGQAETNLRHDELQHALREASDLNTGGADEGLLGRGDWQPADAVWVRSDAARMRPDPVLFGSSHGLRPGANLGLGLRLAVTLDEMVGDSEPMLELARLIRMVASRSATVLIEGETGTGKEIVARALHRLSPRSAKPFAVLNCAAIPEALLEAELFGHTRGAFTGAVQSRTGRIEAAHGGTLFLDEIGEMPLALQSKMLRFLECGELQRVGDNETLRVDVRVIAATHQPLEERATEGSFRLDLYHRLAVFPIEVPSLRRRKEDIAALAEHFLAAMGRTSPRKRLSEDALQRLRDHHWPGNVRELAHVLERATILAGDAVEIGVDHIRLRRATRS
jgi:DNA-binding NtrC family response regulator